MTTPIATAIALAEAIGMTVEEWQSKGTCAQTDPEAFYPEKGGSTREAKRICYGCEVRDKCLEYAIEHDERFGVWGGLSERERRRAARGETVIPVLRTDRRPNGHGHACKCFECQLNGDVE
jgi:hypothetical protein